MKILILCLCAAVTSMAAAGCPSGWKQYSNLCFNLVWTELTWAKAERYCLNMGANLASVHSEGEDNFLRSLTKRYSWIGGYSGGQEGVWLWSDGTRLVYQNWAPSEPSGSGFLVGQHCMAMNFSERWDDGFCYQSHPFICAKRQISPK